MSEEFKTHDEVRNELKSIRRVIKSLPSEYFKKTNMIYILTYVKSIDDYITQNEQRDKTLESERIALEEKHKEELENVKAKWFDTNEELKELKLKSQRRDEDFDRYLELDSTTPTLLTEEEIDEYLLLREKLSK
ncbi:MAG: hypothetical protein RBQ91_02250 [Acholeplasma sp.]|nr:hypothetical protein [Acholeplasma sp.]